MKAHQTKSSTAFLALALLGIGCAGAPKPRTLDGADRVPINDQATIEMLKRRAAEDEGQQPKRPVRSVLPPAAEDQ